MIFYDCPTAPSPRRARIFLAEKNAEFETINIDLANSEQLSDSYKAINPRCTVPALQLESGTVLTENAGIAAYLETRYPDNPLLGTNPEEKGLIAGWTASIEFDGLFAVAEALRNSSPGLANRAITGPDNYPQIPLLAERGLLRLKLFFERLNAHLRNRDYVVGDNFSNADITAVVATDFARIVKVRPLDEHEEISRWRNQLNVRPSLSL